MSTATFCQGAPRLDRVCSEPATCDAATFRLVRSDIFERGVELHRVRRFPGLWGSGDASDRIWRRYIREQSLAFKTAGAKLTT